MQVLTLHRHYVERNTRSYTKERITEIWRDNKLIVDSTEKSVTIDKTVSLSLSLSLFFSLFRIFFRVTVPLHRKFRYIVECLFVGQHR